MRDMICDSDIADFACFGISRLKQLKVLSLGLKYMNVADDAVSELGKAVGSLQNVK